MLKYWISDTLTRVFPLALADRNTTGGRPDIFRHSMRLELARGEEGAAQLSYYFDGVEHAAVDLQVGVGTKQVQGMRVEVKRIGLVPVARHNTATPVEELDGVGHIPGMVPDVLWPDTAHLAAPMMVNGYWINVYSSVDTPPGVYEIVLSLKMNNEQVGVVRISVRVAPTILKPRQNFPVLHWFYADSIHDWYKFEDWSPAFWDMLDKYLAHYVSVGNDTVYVPVFTPPLDGVKRPTQLLGIKRTGSADKPNYKFDWSRVDQWIDHAKRAGIKHFEWTHLFTQWGVKHAIRIYHATKNDPHTLLWPPETLATGEVYRRFLSQFLPELHAYLLRKNLLEVSFFHLSDEPNAAHLEAYKAARSLLAELAPWMKTMDALSHLEFAQVTDMPVPSIREAVAFKNAGIPSWCYFCCDPRGRYINRLMDTPLSKIRMSGWLFYRLGFKGFLHWGYNYWYQCQTRTLIDPFNTSDGHKWPTWPYGDPFIVYPGTDGPLDTIRGRVFAHSLQDYALLQSMEIKPEDRRLVELINFEEFPRTVDWVPKLRHRLLARIV